MTKGRNKPTATNTENKQSVEEKKEEIGIDPSIAIPDDVIQNALSPYFDVADQMALAKSNQYFHTLFPPRGSDQTVLLRSQENAITRAMYDALKKYHTVSRYDFIGKYYCCSTPFDPLPEDLSKVKFDYGLLLGDGSSFYGEGEFAIFKGAGGRAGPAGGWPAGDRAIEVLRARDGGLPLDLAALTAICELTDEEEAKLTQQLIPRPSPSKLPSFSTRR